MWEGVGHAGMAEVLERKGGQLGSKRWCTNSKVPHARATYLVSQLEAFSDCQKELGESPCAPGPPGPVEW